MKAFNWLEYSIVGRKLMRILCKLGIHLRAFIICQDGFWERHCFYCQQLLSTDEGGNRRYRKDKNP